MALWAGQSRPWYIHVLSALSNAQTPLYMYILEGSGPMKGSQRMERPSLIDANEGLGHPYQQYGSQNTLVTYGMDTSRQIQAGIGKFLPRAAVGSQLQPKAGQVLLVAFMDSYCPPLAQAATCSTSISWVGAGCKFYSDLTAWWLMIIDFRTTESRQLMPCACLSM